ncbi:multiple epidermal growth factor-like domains protein 10 isoform X6 [Ostrea edulis]|uniref:multiple epidermal growth factor-like domains protein 10 isoform X6 n=1 Tax=Ostrea edulis TaxID=37623 RepID=UPI0024AF4025|nr:multiple epidermal growth factor-like domains protein 10 isoform X6 [Ostrea edulis]
MEVIVVFFLSILLVTVNTASSQNNSRDSCLPGFYRDEVSHQCQSCPIGYHGHKCSLPCRYPSYGERCHKECNCTVEYCTSDKGCINKTIYENIGAGCEAGYYGRDCSVPCRYPNYGKKCQSECNCTKTLCSHITGCQPRTDNVLIYTTTEKDNITGIILIYTTTEKDDHSTAVKEDLQTVIIIGCSIVFGVIVFFVSIIIALVKRNKQSKRKKEQDCDVDSEFSSYQSIRSDTERSTTSGRYCRNIHELNGKQAQSQELEIYENTSIQETMRTFHP